MPLDKQRRRELLADRRRIRAQKAATKVRCDPTKFAPYNSYGQPEFASRGYYEDVPFRCIGCGKDEVWTALQQKWWYEVAKGYPYSIARRCRPCRRTKRSGIATPKPR